MNIIPMNKLAAAITAAGKAHAKVDSTWQELAVSAIAAVAEHGNTHYVNAVFLALGKGARHSAMTAFMLAFGGVEANTTDSKDTKPFLKSKDKTADVESAKANPWFDFKPSPAPDQTLDYLALVMKVIKKKAKEDQTIEHGKLREMLVQTVNAYAEATGEKVAGLPGVVSTDADELAGIA